MLDENSTYHKIAGSLLEKESLLLQRVAEGDQEAYSVLFLHYLPKLNQFIYPLTAQSQSLTQEVIQEIFLVIWEKRVTLLAIRSFDSYLFRMAKNKVIDLLRKEESWQRHNWQYGKTVDTQHAEPADSIQYAEYHKLALEGIDQLSPKLKTVFLLSTRDDLSLDKISAKLGLPKETIRKRLYLASHQVKKYLKEHAGWLVSLIAFLHTLANK